jgi:hypothetical protein
MQSIRDIKILIFVGYAVSYILAVFGPIFIDPILKSHVLFGQRTYPCAILCIPIYTALLLCQSILLWRGSTTKSLYMSVVIYIISILLTFPLFLPEFPHGNVFSVAMTSSFLSAFTIFVWWICNNISIDDREIRKAGTNTLDYIKTLFAFARQGAFAGVALFGALFFASYATGFKFIEAVVTEKSDIFLLNANVNAQIAFYATYCVVGPIRYFFMSSMKILGQYRELTKRLDAKAKSRAKRQLQVG